MRIFIKCPCCQDDIEIEIEDNEVKVLEHSIDLSEETIIEILKDKNIELG